MCERMHEFLQLLIYKAMTFSDEIEKVDTVRAYHVRLRYTSLCLFTIPLHLPSLTDEC